MRKEEKCQKNVKELSTIVKSNNIIADFNIFTIIMGKKSKYSFITLIIFLFFGWFFSESNKQQEDFSERAKLSLRAIGNQLLLSNMDSTSLVLPVTSLGKTKYKLSFQKKLFIEPNHLVTIVISQTLTSPLFILV